jgi:hypothetical protein
MRLEIFLRVADGQDRGHVHLDAGGLLNGRDQLLGVVALQRVLFPGVGRRIGQLVEGCRKSQHRFVGGVAATVDRQRVRQIREQHLNRALLPFAQLRHALGGDGQQGLPAGNVCDDPNDRQRCQRGGQQHHHDF